AGVFASLRSARSHHLSAHGDAGTDEKKQHEQGQEQDEFALKQGLYERSGLMQWSGTFDHRVGSWSCDVERTLWIQRPGVGCRSRRIEALSVSQVFHRRGHGSAAVFAKAILAQNLCATGRAICDKSLLVCLWLRQISGICSAENVLTLLTLLWEATLEQRVVPVS